MIPQDTVNKILESAQIAEVVGDFVSLKRRGANLVACCPFHNEKTPSFYVSPAKGIYKCFGCGKSGTSVGFIMEHESLSYVDALKYLARKYGIEVVEKEETAEEIAARQHSESLYLVTDFAHKFFCDSLNTDEGRTIGLAYFRSRGLEDVTIRKYGLGWSPKSRHGLLDTAREAGYKDEYLLETGLCVSHDDGRVTDKFFDRVMFPIHSDSGRVVGFGGRTLLSGHPTAKYVNSPSSEIYDKSRTLYGIWFAKSEISRQQKCYLVEGYLDVLSMHQLGITNVVASSGTSLTVPQIRLIKKYAQNVTIMYDGDSAGIHAALRGIGLILAEGLNVKVVLIPDGDDPDSYSRKHTLEEVQDFIASNEQDFINFKTDLLLSDAGTDPLKRADLINDIADTIALIPDPVKRAVYAQTVADKFAMDETVVTGRIGSTRKKLIEDEKKVALRQRTRERQGQYPSQTGEAGQNGDVGSLDSDISRPEIVPAETVASAHNEPLQRFENPMLAAAERDLLWFLYKYGVWPLKFETDSEFYDSESVPIVADFIRDAITADRHEFENSLYKRAWDAFYKEFDTLTDEDLTPPDSPSGNDGEEGRMSFEEQLQNRLQLALMNGPDREISALTASLTQAEYQLTVHKLAASMMTVPSMLRVYVPRTILIYLGKQLDCKVAKLTAEMRMTTDTETQLKLMGEIAGKTKMRMAVEKKLNGPIVKRK